MFCPRGFAAYFVDKMRLRLNALIRMPMQKQAPDKEIAWKKKNAFGSG
jgi:hypothetical protein